MLIEEFEDLRLHQRHNGQVRGAGYFQILRIESRLLGCLHHIPRAGNGDLIVLIAIPLLVTANTMSIAVRERQQEIGVLKTLGFSSGLVMTLILSEALLIALMQTAANQKQQRERVR